MNEDRYVRSIPANFASDCPFSREELSMIIPCILKSVMELKESRTRSISQENGDIYTNLRRNFTYSGYNFDDIKKLLSSDKASFTRNSRWNTRQKYFVRLIEQIKGEHMVTTPSDNDDLNQLSITLSRMDQGTKELEELNKRAEQVMGRLLDINKTLTLQEEEEHVG